MTPAPSDAQVGEVFGWLAFVFTRKKPVMIVSDRTDLACDPILR